jgi:hypothetical protein
MKTIASLLGVVALGLSLSSCTFLHEKYAANEKASVAYLADKKTGTARINIEGVWYAPGWGAVVLNQEGSKVTGAFNDYFAVDGVVSGRKAFLILTDDDWREYTVELTSKGREKLVGFYSAHVPFSESDQKEIVLTRIGD